METLGTLGTESSYKVVRGLGAGRSSMVQEFWLEVLVQSCKP